MEAENGTFFIVFRMMVASACGESFPHAETRVPRAETGVPCVEERLRIVFCMQRTVSVCRESFPHAETRWTRSPLAETRAKFRMVRKRRL